MNEIKERLKKRIEDLTKQEEEANNSRNWNKSQNCSQRISELENQLKFINSLPDQITIISLEKERMEWSFKTFPEATPRSSLLKLQDEVKEVLKEISQLEKNPDGDEGLGRLSMEYADCLMCLFDSAGRAGLSIEELFESFSEKLEINKNRIWKKNSDNTYSHISKTNGK